MSCMAVRSDVSKTPQKAFENSNPFWTWKKVALVASTVLAATAVSGFKTGGLPIPVAFACAIGSAALFTTVATATLIEKIKKNRVERLTPELLDFLFSDVSMGLRCVPARGDLTNVQQAEEEKAYGVCGDSLNLDPSDINVWEKFCPDDKPNDECNTDHNKFIISPAYVSAKRKQAVIARWENGVDDFIRFQVIGSRSTNDLPVFLLLNYPKSETSASDLDRYGQGLGKRGRQMIPSDNIHCLLLPPSDPHLTDEELVKFYRSSLIREIRKLATR